MRLCNDSFLLLHHVRNQVERREPEKHINLIISYLTNSERTQTAIRTCKKKE